MYLTAKRYEGVVDLKQVGERMSDGLVAMMSDMPGFICFYCTEADDDVMVTTSVFETRVSAEESDRRTTSWARENLGFLAPNAPRTTAGEVVASGRRVT